MPNTFAEQVERWTPTAIAKLKDRITYTGELLKQVYPDALVDLAIAQVRAIAHNRSFDAAAEAVVKLENDLLH
jgi:hypothetical protein